MSDVLFATPVDERTLVVRHSPETSLLVYREPAEEHAQLFVAQPASWPALADDEVARLRAYFAWEAEAGYWWRTMRPASVTLEAIGGSVWAARLVERGDVVHAGDDPARPPAGEFVFHAVRVDADTVIRDPLGPVPRPDASGESVVLRAPAMLVERASLPAWGGETIWLRTFVPGFERHALGAALDAEIAVLRAIHDRRPDVVPRVRREGRLETLACTGRFVAMEPIPGLDAGSAFALAARTHADGATRLVIAAGISVIKAMHAAHRAGHAIGPVSPALLRMRPSFTPVGRPHASIVALPSAGPLGSDVPPGVLDLYPDGRDARLRAQLEAPSRREIASDLAALGFLLEWLQEIGESGSVPLHELATALRDGRISRVQVAAAQLKEILGGD
jgi:hypothetical protein